VVSNSLDEYIIRDVILQGARIDSFGVGERLITSKSDPVFGGVYKLAAVETAGRIEPRMKISENVEKITNPGFKKVYRLFCKRTGEVMADVIALAHEAIPQDDGFEIFHPSFTWKRKRLKDFRAKELQTRIFDAGKRVYASPSVEDIRAYCKEQVETLWEESLRFENPAVYYVDLSPDLWDLRADLIRKYKTAFE
jgi:nicotinate phosphoribosyltransferase